MAIFPKDLWEGFQVRDADRFTKDLLDKGQSLVNQALYRPEPMPNLAPPKREEAPLQSFYGSDSGGLDTSGGLAPFSSPRTQDLQTPKEVPIDNSTYPSINEYGGVGDAPFYGPGGGGNANVRKFGSLIDEAAQKYGVPQSVIAGIMHIESGGKPDAISPAGARGLVQVMPDIHGVSADDLMDPRTNVLTGAKILSDNFRRWGSWDKAAAAYFGAIDKDGNITGATDAVGQTGNGYVSAFNGARGNYSDMDRPVKDNISPRTNSDESLTPNQLNLSDAADAYSACGPAAAIAFAKANGRYPTLEEAIQLGKELGTYQSGVGTAGPDAEVKTIKALGIAAHKVDGVDWDKVAQDVQGGNPVIIDTPGHYWVVEGYDPQTGKFNFGMSAAILKSVAGEGVAPQTAIQQGKTWMTPQEMAGKGMGDARSSIFLDNPASEGLSYANHQLSTDPTPDDTVHSYTKRLLDNSLDISNSLVKGWENLNSSFGQSVSAAGDSIDNTKKYIEDRYNSFASTISDDDNPLKRFVGGILEQAPKSFGEVLADLDPRNTENAAIRSGDILGQSGALLGSGFKEAFKGTQLEPNFNIGGTELPFGPAETAAFTLDPTNLIGGDMPKLPLAMGAVLKGGAARAMIDEIGRKWVNGVSPRELSQSLGVGYDLVSDILKDFRSKYNIDPRTISESRAIAETRKESPILATFPNSVMGIDNGLELLGGAILNTGNILGQQIAKDSDGVLQWGRGRIQDIVKYGNNSHWVPDFWAKLEDGTNLIIDTKADFIRGKGKSLDKERFFGIEPGQISYPVEVKTLGGKTEQVRALVLNDDALKNNVPDGFNIRDFVPDPTHQKQVMDSLAKRNILSREQLRGGIGEVNGDEFFTSKTPDSANIFSPQSGSINTALAGRLGAGVAGGIAGFNSDPNADPTSRLFNTVKGAALAEGGLGLAKLMATPGLSMEQKINAVRYSSMLSQTTTLTGNVLGGAYELLWKVSDDVLSQSPKKSAQELGVLVKGLGDAAGAAFNTLKTGQTVTPSALAPAAANQKVSNVPMELQWPTRILASTDEFFHNLIFNTEIWRQAYDKSRGGMMVTKGKTTVTIPPSQALQKYINNQNLFPEMVQRAMDEADYYTFRTPLEGAAKKFDSLVEDLGVPGRIFVPFFRAVYNITARGLERTPIIGTVIEGKQVLEGERTVGSFARDQSKAFAIGSAALMYALSDGITGAGPQDPNDRRQLERMGWQPYSIRFADGKYHSFQNLGTLAAPLAAVASVVDAIKYTPKSNIDPAYGTKQSMVNFANFMLNNTYLSGISDAIAAAHDPNQSFQTWAQGVVSSFVPLGGIVNQAERATDPYVRQPTGIIEGVEQRLPGGNYGTIPSNVPFVGDTQLGGRQSLNPRLDQWGQPIQNPQQGFMTLDPNRSNSQRATQLDQELKRLDISPAPSQGIIDDTKLTAKQKYELGKEQGQNAYAALTRLLDTPEYQSANDEMRKKLINADSRFAKEIATKVVQSNLGIESKLKDLGLPQKYYGVDSLEQTKKIDDATSKVSAYDRWANTKGYGVAPEKPTDDEYNLAYGNQGNITEEYRQFLKDQAEKQKERRGELLPFDARAGKK